MQENIQNLKIWLSEILSDIEKIKVLKHESDIIVFMIGSTSAFAHDMNPYKTPIRKINKGYVLGSIVFSQTQASILSMAIDGQVDYVYLDAEKKLPVLLEPDHSPYHEFNFEPPKVNSENNVELGNISSACYKLIEKSTVCEYKGNDVTINAVWHFLTEFFGDMSGKKIVIYGSGNIGSKLALKLVESGANIDIISRDYNSASMIVSALNKIKNHSVLSSVKIATNKIYSSLNADAIIGCTNSVPVITKKMINVMKSSGVVIDVGKGTLTNSSIKICTEKGIQLWRADITSMIDSLVSSSRETQELLANRFGRREIDSNICIVSGGYIGDKYDVVVDSYKAPTIVIGVCAGRGEMMSEVDDVAKENLIKVQEYIESIIINNK